MVYFGNLNGDDFWLLELFESRVYVQVLNQKAFSRKRFRGFGSNLDFE